MYSVFNLILKDFCSGPGHSGIQIIIISQEGIKSSGRASVLNGVAKFSHLGWGQTLSHCLFPVPEENPEGFSEIESSLPMTVSGEWSLQRFFSALPTYVIEPSRIFLTISMEWVGAGLAVGLSDGSALMFFTAFKEQPHVIVLSNHIYGKLLMNQ